MVFIKRAVNPELFVDIEHLMNPSSGRPFFKPTGKDCRGPHKTAMLGAYAEQAHPNLYFSPLNSTETGQALIEKLQPLAWKAANTCTLYFQKFTEDIATIPDKWKLFARYLMIFCYQSYQFTKVFAVVFHVLQLLFFCVLTLAFFCVPSLAFFAYSR